MSWINKRWNTRCLPCCRRYEVANSVLDGPRSAVFKEAENVLHVRTTLVALTMA